MDEKLINKIISDRVLKKICPSQIAIFILLYLILGGYFVRGFESNNV